MPANADAEPPSLTTPPPPQRNCNNIPAAADDVVSLRSTPQGLGRVADLEAHVRPDWWRIIFDELYLKTDGDVFENDDNTRAEVDSLVAAAKLHPSDRILDLCCGQGRHAIELARRGFGHVTGVDQSSYLINLARRRARAAGLEIAFIEADARHSHAAEAQFDCVLMLGNSFGYFEHAEDDAALLRRARRSLRTGGRLALDLVDGDWTRANFEPRSWEWLDDRLMICRERSLSADGERLITREIILDAGQGIVEDRFFGERLYTRQQITALLESQGFATVTFIAATAVTSDTDADLGMMACRQLVLARAAPEAPVRCSGRPREVAVVLGDPRIPDRVKPDGRFGPGDLHTIERLRGALAELDGYRFSYIDDHGALLEQLRAARPALVLNLCDEGYRNDAGMEAHVAALLDVLGVPYSGAGPACLTLCYDKAVVRSMAASLGVPVPDEISIGADDRVDGLPVRFPAFIKPCHGDNSVGIDANSVADTPAEAAETIERLRRMLPGSPLLVQEYLHGCEYSLGVIGNPGQPFELLPILEVDYSALDPTLPPILAYGSKWEPGSAYATQIRYQRASLPEASERRMAHHALRLFRRLGCRDYARFDFRADAAGEIKLLEVNPNPGWCWDSKLAIMAGFAGLQYPDLLRLILNAAERRLSLPV